MIEERQGIIMLRKVNGILRQTNLTNESAEYLTAREQVRLAEIELMRARERVAELRRALPKGAEVQDYKFLDCSFGALPDGRATAPKTEALPNGRVSDKTDALPNGRVSAEGPASLTDGDGPVSKIRLSELFTAPDRSLVVYHFMFGKKQTTACPMCTAWIDGYNGVAHHLAQTTDFAIVAAADPADLRAYARERGWNKLRLLSAGESTFKYDLGSEDREGNQDSEISVFTRESDETLRHFYSGHPWLDPNIKGRGIDELSPIWNLLDLTPQGRAKFYTSLDYGTKVQIARR
jgi:predicted dithiol-disulfide oxidoreductase (DUF899 family)